eukprot:scaffold21073_cov45-Isochrysis_galbana.AAC.1
MLEEQSGMGNDGRLTFDDFKLLMLRAGREEDPNQQVRHAAPGHSGTHNPNTHPHTHPSRPSQPTHHPPNP